MLDNIPDNLDIWTFWRTQVLEARWMGWSPWKSHRFWIDCLASFRAIGSTCEFWWRKLALCDPIEQVPGLNMAYHMKWTWAHDGLWWCIYIILDYGWVIWGNACRKMIGILGEKDKLPSSTQSLKDWGTMPYKSARTLESIKVICISPRTCDDLCIFIKLPFQLLFRLHYDSLRRKLLVLMYLSDPKIRGWIPSNDGAGRWYQSGTRGQGLAILEICMEAAAFHGDASGGSDFVWFCVQTKVEGWSNRDISSFPACIIRLFMTAIFYLCLTRPCWSSFRHQWLATILLVKKKKWQYK